jgi:hypothetical protein
MRSMKGNRQRGASIENQPRSVAVLNVGGMDDDVQQEAERIDKDMTLAPGDLLARIIPLQAPQKIPVFRFLASKSCSKDCGMSSGSTTCNDNQSCDCACNRQPICECR